MSSLPGWTEAELLRAGALYMPLLATLGAVLAGRYREPRPRQFPAALLSVLWMLPSLLFLQQLNRWAHWWAYTPSPAMLLGMPVELLLGWAILWGVLPQLAAPRRLTTLPIAAHVAIVATFLVALDLVLMPLCRPAVTLKLTWLVGEAAACTLVLLPALTLAQATRLQRCLAFRGVLQLTLAGGLFLYVIPELAFALAPAAPVGRHCSRSTAASPGWPPAASSCSHSLASRPCRSLSSAAPAPPSPTTRPPASS